MGKGDWQGVKIYYLIPKCNRSYDMIYFSISMEKKEKKKEKK